VIKEILKRIWWIPPIGVLPILVAIALRLTYRFYLPYMPIPQDGPRDAELFAALLALVTVGIPTWAIIHGIYVTKRDWAHIRRSVQEKKSLKEKEAPELPTIPAPPEVSWRSDINENF
jgi:hypothetical protein